MYGVLGRADFGNCNAKNLQNLQDDEKACAVFQKKGAAPYRFRVSLSNEDTVFNKTIWVDLTEIIGDTVLHTANSNRKLEASALLPAQTKEPSWSPYIEIRPLKYTLSSQYTQCDQKPQFQFQRWEGLISGTEHMHRIRRA